MNIVHAIDLNTFFIQRKRFISADIEVMRGRGTRLQWNLYKKVNDYSCV